MRNTFQNLIRNTFSVVLIVCAISGQSVLAGSGGTYVLDWSTIDGGGRNSSGGKYNLTGTIGQHDAAYSKGWQYEILGGFWPAGPLCFVEFEDFARFAQYWLLTGPGLPADLHEDVDNIVNYYDLKKFLDDWLCYCPYDWPLK